MTRGLTGQWIPQSIEGRDYEAFLPRPLPPEPPIEWNGPLVKCLTRATGAVTRLDGAARLLPDLQVFLYGYVRKEAVLSSQIEGTQSSLDDLLRYESDAVTGVPLNDVLEVSRYLHALEIGVARIQSGEAISKSLILDLHRMLLSTGRGSDKDPGQIRTKQNWIGGATPDRAKFVPTPPESVERCLDQLLAFWKTSEEPTLVKAALVHAQFETIHPFRDGNGRIGRLLITLLLCQDKLIAQPLVYLSLHFKENRDEYYSRLQAIRTEGQWEEWLSFFLTGIAHVTESAFILTQQLQTLFEQDTDLIRSSGGRKAGGMNELYRAFQNSPILSIPKAEKILKSSVSKPTLYAAAEELVKLNILSRLPREGGETQLYVYTNYVQLLQR